jgi:hypothetical protein
MEWDGEDLHALDSDECLRLLSTQSVGRLAVSSGALPVVMPVRYEVRGADIVVRVTRGSRLEAAARHSIVAFEADDIHPGDHSGWSVSVTGLARPLDRPVHEACHGDGGTAERQRGDPDDCRLAIYTDVMFGLRNLRQVVHGGPAGSPCDR